MLLRSSEFTERLLSSFLTASNSPSLFFIFLISDSHNFCSCVTNSIDSSGLSFNSSTFSGSRFFSVAAGSFKGVVVCSKILRPSSMSWSMLEEGGYLWPPFELLSLRLLSEFSRDLREDLVVLDLAVPDFEASVNIYY